MLELNGYGYADKSEVIEEKHIIKCADCNKPNAIIIKTNSKKRCIDYNITTKCFCGGESFLFKIHGDIKMSPTDNVNIVDVLYDHDNNKTTIILEERK